jgi:hypothetical protein
MRQQGRWAVVGINIGAAARANVAVPVAALEN